MNAIGYAEPSQRSAISAYAASHGYTITEWVTGDLDPHQVDAVIVFSPSDTLSYCYQLYSLAKKGIDLISVTPVPEDLVSVAAYIARKERENLTQRTTQGKIEKSARGGYVGGRAPYGYSVSDRSLVINPDEAPIVRTIFSMYDAGHTQADIVRSLNAQNFSTRTGGPFLAQHVRSIRMNRPFYEGLYRSRTGKWVKGQHEPLLDTDPLS